MVSNSAIRNGVLLAVFSAAILALSPATASARTYSCSARDSKTVRNVGNVRIFSRVKPSRFNPAVRYKAIYACSKSYGHRFELRTDDFPGEDKYEDFVVAGRFLAYVMTYSCGACGSPPVWPMVLDLKYGRTTVTAQPRYVTADLGPDCSGRSDLCGKVFERLLLRRTASFAVAYKATELGDAPNVTLYVIEKHEIGSGLRSERVSVLDLVSSTSDLATLKLSGDVLTWRNASQSKSATIK